MTPREDKATDPAETSEEEATSSDSSFSDLPPASVTPTLIAVAEDTIGADLPPSADANSQVIPQLLAVEAVAEELRAYAALINHYYYWASLAMGSWSELDIVAQVKKNCAALQDQLDNQDPHLDGLADLKQKLQETIANLNTLTQQGPQNTHFFCAQKLALPQATEIATELRNITHQDIALSHLDQTRYSVGVVLPKEAAFVQGIRAEDGAFISEAYLSSSIYTDQNKLREFVLDQIESFHADPHSVGKKIRFQGNFSKEYLIEAINYCNLRGYAWEVHSDLINQVVTGLSPAEKNNLTNLINHHTEDKVFEDSWKNWLVDHNKKPFSELLDKESLHIYENNLQLRPLDAFEKAAAKNQVDHFLKQHLMNESRPSPRQHSSSRQIIRNPSPPIFSVSIENTNKNKDEEQGAHEDRDENASRSPAASLSIHK